MTRPVIAGVVWILGSLPVALFGAMLLTFSDHDRDHIPGALMLGLAIAGVAVGAWLLFRRDGAAAMASRWLSVAWLVSGVGLFFFYQAFLVDALWIGGPLTVTAILTGLLIGVRPSRVAQQ